MVHLRRRSSSTMSRSPSTTTMPTNDVKEPTLPPRHRRHSLRNISSALSAIIIKTSSSSSSSSESSSAASSVLENTKNKLVSRRKSAVAAKTATLARISDTSRLSKFLNNKKSHAESSDKLKRRSWSGVLQGIKRRDSSTLLGQQQQHGLLPPPAAAAPPSPPSHHVPSIIAEEELDQHPCDIAVKEPMHASMADHDEAHTETSISMSSISSVGKTEHQQPAVANESACTIPTDTLANENISAKSSLSSLLLPPLSGEEEKEAGAEEETGPGGEAKPETEAETMAEMEAEAGAAAPVALPSPVFDEVAGLLEDTLGRTSALELDCGTQNGSSRIESVLGQLGYVSSPDAPGIALSCYYFGATVGTTAAHVCHDQKENNSTIVTGHCLITEPGSVPKSLILDDDYEQVMLVRRVTNNTTLMRLRYICHVRHEEATTKFAKCPSSEWVPDHQVQACQHKSCLHTFGFFMRRHHCRSCGHIFCYKHSANQLALFDFNDNAYSNSRVCDGCFYRLLQ